MGEAAEVLAVDIEEPRLLTREQAADYLCVSLDTFDRVKDSIRHVQFTKRTVRYDPKDLETWLEHRKVGGSTGALAESPSSGSGTRRRGTTSARANAHLEKLTRKRSASMQPSSPTPGDR